MDRADPAMDHDLDVWDRIGPDYARKRPTPWSWLADHLQGFDAPLGTDDRGPPPVAIDLGCGHGRAFRLLTGRGYEVFGIEAAASLRDLARGEMARMPGVTEVLPWEPGHGAEPLRVVRKKADRPVHLVLSAAVHHLLFDPRERREILAACHEILDPDGTLVLTTWDREAPRFDPRGDEREPARPHGRDRREDPPTVRIPWPLDDGGTVVRRYLLFDMDTLRAEVEEAGPWSELSLERKAGNLLVTARP